MSYRISSKTLLSTQITKLFKFVRIFVGVALIPSCATSKQDVRAGVNLYSWRLRNAQYAFVFVPKKENEKFLRTFNPEMPHIAGIAGLDLELAKFPPGSPITWRDYEGIGLVFPSARIRSQIQKLASARSIHLEIVPTIYD